MTIGCSSQKRACGFNRSNHALHVFSFRYKVNWICPRPDKPFLTRKAAPAGPLVELHVGRRCLDLLRAPGLRRPSPAGIVLTAATKEHAAHHIQQWVPLPRDLDGEVLFANLGQSVLPKSHISDLSRIVCSELSEEIGTTTLNRQEQQIEEVEQGKRRTHPDVGAGAAHILHAEGRVCGRQPGGEDEQGFVRAAKVSGQEIRENCARRIDGRGVRFIVRVPLILEFRQGLRRFRGSQDEVFLGIVRLIICEWPY